MSKKNEKYFEDKFEEEYREFAENSFKAGYIEAEELAKMDYLEYADGTLRDRAIPCVFDNCKPVQRRILYSMYDLKIFSDTSPKKCARIIGDVIGRFQTSGDCLDGDTVICLLNGDRKTIKEMYESGVNEVEVLSFDPNSKKMVPAVATNFRIGQYANTIYDIKFSGGGNVKATSNHQFLTTSGWKSADTIAKNDIIINCSLNTANEYISVRGIYNTKEHLHKVILETPNSTDYVRHHINEDKHDNRLENLCVLTRVEHAKHHNGEIHLEALRKGRETMSSGKYAEILSYKTSMMMDQLNKHNGLLSALRVLRYLDLHKIDINVTNYAIYRSCVYNGAKLDKILLEYSWEELVDIYRNGGVKLEMDDINKKVIEFARKHDISFYSKENRRSPDIDDRGDSAIQWITYNAIKNHIINLAANGYEINWDNLISRPASSYNFTHNEKQRHKENMIAVMKEHHTIDNLLEFLGRVGCIQLVTDVKKETVDNKPMYDFTVDGYENMFIEVAYDGVFRQMVVAHNSGPFGALVTMVRSYVNNIPYIIGQGGFGTQDAPFNADMRYVEAKLAPYSEKYLLRDLKYNAVEFIPNYDEEEMEPKFLPAVLPDILINGNIGIATPYMCWIPPHNVTDVIKLCIKFIKNPKMSITEMMHTLQGPDFPTGGVISQMSSVYRFYQTGKGACTITGKWHKEVDDSKTYLVIDELPYMRTQETFMENLSVLKADKDIGYLIAGVEDLSANGEIKLRIRVSTGTKYDELVDILLKKTCLQYSQVLNMMVLLDNKEYKLLNLKEVMEYFVSFRSKCLYNKFKYELENNLKRYHLLEGVVIINKDMDKAISIIRKSNGKEDSIVKLMKAFPLSKEQADYIVMMRVYRLSNLEINIVKDEMKGLKERRTYLEKITASDKNRYLDAEMLIEWEDILSSKDINKKRRTTIEK